MVTKLFANLCETPPIFYAVCVAVMALGKVDATFIRLANAYFGLRLVHAGIFVTFNHPRMRAAPYLLSWFTMVAMSFRLYQKL